MPPPDSGLELTDQQRGLLRKWIQHGANYEAHWAFVPPSVISPTHIQPDKWSRGDLDRYVLQRLTSAGLSPAGDAEPRDASSTSGTLVDGTTANARVGASVHRFAFGRDLRAHHRSFDRLA